MKIDGNTFIVTGGLGGIGGAVAKALLSRGAKVALFDVLPAQKGSLLAAEYHPTDAIYVNVDIANADSTKSGVQIVVEKLGNLKGVVIINFSSAAAHGLYARTLCYGPSKVAVAGITRSMADFLGPSGIRVNSISPSIVQSNMTAGFSGYFNDDLLAHAAFPRKPVPVEEIVRTVVYLVENAYVNGEDIRVDSAWRLVTARTPGARDPRDLAPGLE
ncbi:hypothetical protein V1523DRAFT_436654 [Lipomyces doorenjongii]